MQPIPTPRCPRCIDGGRVQLIELEDEESSVFQPLPSGATGRKKFFQCSECGWKTPVTAPE